MFFKNYKLVNFTNKDFSFLNLKENEVEIPYGENHPGAFGYKRKNHTHEGIDLYCKENDIVISLTNGIVKDIGKFTGKSVGSDWWNETEYIAIEYKDYIIVYGELIVNSNIKINDIIIEGQELGLITPVLKQFKNNRPINMLHLELYDKKSYIEPKEWINDKPKGLLDPFILIDEIFNMEYPSKEEYEDLYKKYIEKDFKFNQYIKFDYKDKIVLDLCGGAGYTSKYMLEEQAKEIDYFDLSKVMIDEEILKNNKVNKIYGNVLKDLPNKKYDYIITKQAINYWFKDIDINYLVNKINTNGYLIFNTFNINKDTSTIYKKYEIDGKEYEEYSFIKDDKIYHIQIKEDKIHKTIFKNIEEEYFKNKLDNYFDIEIIKSNKSIYYFCKKI